jgi:ribulose-bisphosphate carboxylase large chain
MSVMSERIQAFYRVKSDANSIAARAKAIALEQSVEMPVEPIDDPFVRNDIVGRVEDIQELGEGLFEVRISLAAATTGFEPGQLLNMLFGNTSIHEDVVFYDAEFPRSFAASFGGPRQGLEGIRKRVNAKRRALTCSALKPQGLPTKELAELAARMAEGGIDYIKDDHGLADQAYSPFAERVPAIAEAVAAASAKTGIPTRYLPSLSGNIDSLRKQMRQVVMAELDGVLVTPLIVGLPAFHTLVKENPDIAFMTHPAFGGASRIRPTFLFGKLFRLLGSDATVFANYGGRFSYTQEECKDLSAAALQPWLGLKSCVPVPAGGMSLERIPELLDFFGVDVMLLIGGSLLATRERITAETAAYVEAVRAYKA